MSTSKYRSESVLIFSDLGVFRSLRSSSNLFSTICFQPSPVHFTKSGGLGLLLCFWEIDVYQSTATTLNAACISAGDVTFLNFSITQIRNVSSKKVSHAVMVRIRLDRLKNSNPCSCF